MNIHQNFYFIHVKRYVEKIVVFYHEMQWWLLLMLVIRVTGITLPTSTKNVVRVDSTGTMIRIGIRSKGIYYSDDTGVTWTQSNAGTGTWNYMSYFNSYMGAATEDGRLYTSLDYGRTWSL